MVLTGKLLRLWRRLERFSRLAGRWSGDQFRRTYSAEQVPIVSLFGSAQRSSLRLADEESRTLRATADRYLRHEFDQLGSGWRNWNRDAGRVDKVNIANRVTANRIAESLSAAYCSIDWHLDVRSGYRYPCRRWSRLIQPGRVPGVDIKVPWEMSRMQHLVQLALVAVDDRTDMEFAQRCEREINDQIRDFIAANPPRFGVNWRVAMDVAIRAANWVLAVSVLQAHGRDITSLGNILGASLRDHGRFIERHLEWDPQWRGNHYLANLCGLLFVAAALPADSESDAWLAMASAEVIAEGIRQVNADGSGFEGATAYHRLSLDMLVHALALLVGMDGQRLHTACTKAELGRLAFPQVLAAQPRKIDCLASDGSLAIPEELRTRVWYAAAFTRSVTRPDGRALLIGDNDSGRFFKPCPVYQSLQAAEMSAMYPERPVLTGPAGERRELGEDHSHLVAAINALFGVVDAQSIDAGLIDALTKGRNLDCPRNSLETPSRIDASLADPTRAPETLRITFPREIDLAEIALHAYPGWGLYILRGDGLLLSFRCGPLGLSGTGNHDHNDQLGLTLYLDGRDWIADPGTYRYTADLAERDAYRSVKAHFAPRLRDSDAEPGALNEGTWRLGDQAQAVVEQATDRLLQGRHHGFGVPVHRRVVLYSDRCEITDWADGELELLPLATQYAYLNAQGCALPFCPDYGVRHA